MQNVAGLILGEVVKAIQIMSEFGQFFWLKPRAEIPLHCDRNACFIPRKVMKKHCIFSLIFLLDASVSALVGKCSSKYQSVR